MARVASPAAAIAALVLAAAAPHAGAAFPNECENLSQGPRFILERIQLGSFKESLALSTGMHAKVKLLWQQVAEEPANKKALPMQVRFDDCWTVRQSMGIDKPMPHVGDFKRDRVLDLQAMQIMVVSWGILAPSEFRFHFGIVPVLAKSEGTIHTVRLDTVEGTPKQVLDALVNSQILSIVGVLSAIDILLDDVKAGRVSNGANAAGVCVRDAVHSRLGDIGRHAAKLTTDAENAWIGEWIQSLKKENDNVALSRTGSPCVAIR